MPKIRLIHPSVRLGSQQYIYICDQIHDHFLQCPTNNKGRIVKKGKMFERIIKCTSNKKIWTEVHT